MQDVQFNRLMDLATAEKPLPPSKAKAKVKSIETKNRQALEHVELSGRIPTADELEKFRSWAVAYKKASPKASKREVRKAVQNHFGIRIYK
jgi:hypothetical protein